MWMVIGDVMWFGRTAILLSAFVAIMLTTSVSASASQGIHFGTQPVAVATADSLTISGNIVGVGKQIWIDVVVTATSDCAGSISGEYFAYAHGSGNMDYYVTLTPNCATVPIFSNVTVTETVSGITITIPGTFQSTSTLAQIMPVYIHSTCG
jgi:hypothetical protein